MLEVQVRCRLGDFLLEAALEAPPGRVTVVVGESGSGKTTLLRLIAGLIEPDEGRIALDGEPWVDRSGQVFVAAEARSVGYVAQDFALFPHLSAAGNVAFGLRASGLPGREVSERVRRALERFGLASLADRKPHEISGGQQQRVALARALVLDPAVLLLDEPLSALDVVTRRGVRAELRRVLEKLPCVTLFVTHHPTEALVFGERVVVVESGRISQSGTGAELVRHPRSPYVAEFLGVNLFRGEIGARHPDGLATVNVAGSALSVPDPGREGAVRLLVHPHDVVLSADGPTGSARNALRGPVEEIIPEPPRGDRVRVLLATRPPIAAQITQQAAVTLGLRPGVEVFASFKATGVVVLPD